MNSDPTAGLAVDVPVDQLRRMRGMNAAYHRRFFTDVWLTAGSVLALFVAGTALSDVLFLAIPVVALLGANQTAFDASYLTFSRQYAASIERELNDAIGADVLVAHRLEADYLYPLGVRKVVTVPVRGPLTWFGFMTFFYTALGIAAFGVGLVLGVRALGWGWVAAAYLVGLGGLTLSSLATGGWWFVGGAGERRLEAVLDGYRIPPAAGR